MRPELIGATRHDPDGESLVQEVSRALATDVREGVVSVGVLNDGRWASACWDAAESRAIDPNTIAIPASCAVKPLTAVLLVQECVRQTISLDTDVGTLLRTAESDGPPSLHEITLRQLLTHTHGLDDSHVQEIRHGSDGRIDIEFLHRAVQSAPAIHPPGKYFSYGNFGFWVAAAVLERLTGQAYSSLLVDRVLRPANVALHTTTGRTVICPATGRNLSLTVDELLAVCRLLHDLVSRPPPDTAALPLSIMPGKVSPMPGWCLEAGTSVGWKYYGDGWFGANGNAADGSVRLRVNFDRRCTIVVSGTPSVVPRALTRLFNDVLPKARFARTNQRRLTAAEVSLCEGEYSNRALQVRVRSEQGKLHMQIHHALTTPRRAVESDLTAIFGAAFIPNANVQTLFPVVEFLEIEEGGARYLWNGAQLLPKTPESRR